MAPRVGEEVALRVGHRHDEIEGALYLKEYLRKAVDCTKADSIVTEGLADVSCKFADAVRGVGEQKPGCLGYFICSLQRGVEHGVQSLVDLPDEVHHVRVRAPYGVLLGGWAVMRRKTQIFNADFPQSENEEPGRGKKEKGDNPQAVSVSWRPSCLVQDTQEKIPSL